MEEGETFLKAAIRELKEETGYNSKDPHYFMTARYTLPDGRKVKTQRFFEMYDGTQELNCSEGQKIKFLSIEEIREIQCFPGVAKAAEKALNAARNLLNTN